jgi:hypothetical protein
MVGESSQRNGYPLAFIQSVLDGEGRIDTYYFHADEVEPPIRPKPAMASG